MNAKGNQGSRKTSRFQASPSHERDDDSQPYKGVQASDHYAEKNVGHDAVRWNFGLSDGHRTLHRNCPPMLYDAEPEQSFRRTYFLSACQAGRWRHKGPLDRVSRPPFDRRSLSLERPCPALAFSLKV